MFALYTRSIQIAVTDDVEVFPEQPFYAIKKGSQLTVYRFEEKANECQGMKFDITGSEGAITGFRLLHRFDPSIISVDKNTLQRQVDPHPNLKRRQSLSCLE